MNQEVFHKYFSGKATQEEKNELISWMEADERNKREFLSQRRLYDLSIWQKEDEPVHKEKMSSANKKWTTRTIAFEMIKVAAVFLIAFIVLYSFVKDQNPANVASVMQTIFVPPGQRVELTLSDGTKVWLNAKTTFVFPTLFTAGNREVILDGEGYFDVTADPDKPFIVKTGDFNIKVLGTEFNVTAYSGSSFFETALLKGAVEVSSPVTNVCLALEPNMRIYTENGQLKKGLIEHESYFLWKEGLISFDNEPVGEMLDKLQLYYDVKIDVQNKDLLNNNFSGKFRTKDGVEHVLKVLQLSREFTYEKDSELNLITIK